MKLSPASDRKRGRVTASAPTFRQLTPLTSVLLIAAAAAWVGVIVVAEDMGSVPGTMGLGFGSFVAVWALMMCAMMLPSVAPFASLYTRTYQDHRAARLTALAGGYFVVWTLVAGPAYGLGWLTDRVVGNHPAAATGLAVAIFAVCGIYQLTPLKDRCLAHCRSPLGFVLKYSAYRGRTRDLRVGVHHGAFCVGCCWALMALLVAFGLMNVVAMVILAAAVLAEKTWRWGPTFSRFLGFCALVLAIAVIFRPALAPGLHHASTDMGGM